MAKPPRGGDAKPRAQSSSAKVADYDLASHKSLEACHGEAESEDGGSRVTEANK